MNWKKRVKKIIWKFQTSISVVIPVYNAQEYIRECLDSILEHQNIGLEVICVDDCSTDRTPEILEEYRKKYSNVKVLRNSVNIYAGPSRNRGLEIAKGKYVHFMDADDYVVTNMYSKLYKLAKENDLDWIKATAEGFDQNTGKVIGRRYYSFKEFNPELEKTLLDFNSAPEEFSSIAVVPWNGIYKREFLLRENIRFNDLLCVNDRSFFLECCVKAKRVMILKKKFIRHRMNMKESLVGRRARHYDCQIESFKLAKKICDDNQVNDKVRFYIMESEMSSLLYWYLKYKEEGIFPEQMEAPFRELLDQEMGYFEAFGEKSLWHEYKKSL